MADDSGRFPVFVSLPHASVRMFPGYRVKRGMTTIDRLACVMVCRVYDGSRS